MKKRLFAMALAVVMVLAAVPMPASAAFSARSTDPGTNNTTYTSGNPYPKKQCTWYAWGRYKELCGVELPKWGDGQNWYSKAKSAGYSVGDEPKLGAIACWESWNHVAIVEKIEGGNIYVSQYNRKGEEKFGGLDKYSNGSEKKDASGSNIWTAWEMMGVKGSRRGLAGGTPSHYIYLKEESTSVKTSITFDLVTPSSFTVGTDVDLDGSMTATGSKINSVKAEIVNAANGAVVLSASSSGNFSVETYGPLVAKNSKLNSDLDLGKLPVGTYYARFTVGTKDGTTAKGETGRFNVNPVSCNGNHTRGGYLGSADEHPHWVYWKCAICGEKYTEWGVETKDSCEICNPKPDCSNGHTWGGWETMEKADCENDGKRRHICSVCGEREEERIAALGHDYRLTNSTATEEIYICSRCGDSYKKPIDSGDFEIDGGGSCQHQWSDWNVYEYCDMEGWKSRYCKKCGEREEQPLPATGHDWRLDRDGYYRCAQCYAVKPRIGGLPFEPKQAFYGWLFNDISSNAWYYDNVCTAYELGLMKGTGSGTFSPGNNVTLAEAITLAARIHSIYQTGSDDFASYDGGNWYDPYVDYAGENGIVNTYYNYTRPATREEFVHILAKALPDYELTNTVGSVSFADSGSITYLSDVRLLSGAGVINGVQENGRTYFKPLDSITRAEVAAVVSRMTTPGSRLGHASAADTSSVHIVSEAESDQTLLGTYISESGYYSVSLQENGNCEWYQDGLTFYGTYRKEGTGWQLSLVGHSGYLDTTFYAQRINSRTIVVDGGTVHKETFTKP